MLIPIYLNEFPHGASVQNETYSFTKKQLSDFEKWIMACFEKWDIPQANHLGYRAGYKDATEHFRT